MAIQFKKGDRIGRLTIADDTFAYSKCDANGGNKRRYWRCICDCGQETFVNASALKRQSTLSCGCYNKERIIETSRIDETNHRYGKLTVLGYDHTTNNKSYWKCMCDCGNITVVSGPALRTGNTSSCGLCNFKSKGEQAIQNYLEKNNISFAKEYKTDLKDKQFLRFDFAIFQDGVLIKLIEFNGRQHYEQGGFQTAESFATQQAHDKMKEDWCNSHNLPLLVIKWNSIDQIETILDNFFNQG